MTTAQPLEIFCGTGGVGKTTLAASRGVFLAQQQKCVLLITTDPSQRLREVLSLTDCPPGTVVETSVAPGSQLNVLLMSPTATWRRVAPQKKTYQPQQLYSRHSKPPLWGA